MLKHFLLFTLLFVSTSTQNLNSVNTKLELAENLKLTEKQTEKCSLENCPVLQGVCYENECLCSYGWATLKGDNLPKINCNYQQRSKMTAFLLEFFFPFGAGHMYAGNTVLAVIKFVFFFLFFVGVCAEICCLFFRKGTWQTYYAIFVFAAGIIWLLFQLTDIVCYGLGIYTDGHNVPLI